MNTLLTLSPHLFKSTKKTPSSNNFRKSTTRKITLDPKKQFENPLVGRYSSEEMNFIFSPQKKFSTWRYLWIALATAQKEQGLNITDEQIAEMEAFKDDVNFEVAEAKEKELRHDVMSHIFAFGEQCPKAAPIIHLGATSCFVGDNTDLIQMKEGLELIRNLLVQMLHLMKNFALEHKDQPTLGFTHFQAAQLTTVGKRMTLWMQDFMYDLEAVENMISNLPFRSAKGTTGTQASFLSLFNGDHDKCRALEKRVTELMGFTKTLPVSGQTYTRKIDYQVLSILSGIAQSANKMATDIRLLMHMKEIEEPFGNKQVGSSAMAYKRNPMRSERICSLARYVISLEQNGANTHANQWFERTLDDSANRRLTIPEGFLSIDVILRTMSNVVEGMQVWPLVINKHIEAELPFMATENIIMAGVKAGGNRQELHESIRTHSMEASKTVKLLGKDNDLLERIKNDDQFASIRDNMEEILDPKTFVGRAPEQVNIFITEEIDPILSRYESLLKNITVKDLKV